MKELPKKKGARGGYINLGGRLNRIFPKNISWNIRLILLLGYI